MGRLCRGVPGGTFFHLAGWRRVIETAFRHRTFYLMAERDGIVTGVLPLTLVKTRLFGTRLISNAFCVRGGPIAADDGEPGALDAAAVRLMEELRVPVLEFRSAADHRSDWITKGDLYASFRKPIDPSVDRNMKAIPRKQRAMVRKGIRNGLRSEIDRDADRLHRVYGESVRNLGTPVFSKKYFDLLLDDISGAFRHRHDYHQRRQAGRVGVEFLFSRRSSAVLRRRHRRGARGWPPMISCIGRSCGAPASGAIGVFDFGRSKIGTGAYDFKTYWGFEPTPLVYQFRLARRAEDPGSEPAQPEIRAVRQLWKKLPLAVAARLGPPIVRGLG